jgi:methionyl aminopeptidase
MSLSSLSSPIVLSYAKILEKVFTIPNTDSTLTLLQTLGNHHDEMKQWISTWIQPNMTFHDITQTIETEIIHRELKPAFPVCISLNDCAAHDLSSLNDTRRVSTGDFCKIDFGLQKNGYIIDSAYTYVIPSLQDSLETLSIGSLDQDIKNKLLECGREAVATGLRHLGPDAILGEIGANVQEIVESYDGFHSCWDLSGHSIALYRVHGKKAVPNIRYDYNMRVQEGDYLSFEPFITNGTGETYTTANNELYMFNYFQYAFSHVLENPGNYGLMEEELGFLQTIYNEYYTLAFCKRWLQMNLNFQRYSKKLKWAILLNKLTQKNLLVKFPPIHQREKGWVVQFEDNVFIRDDKVIRISRSHDLNIS